MLVVLTTTSNPDEAESLAKGIIERRLGACVQILPAIKSFYFWEGKVRNETEHLLFIKTTGEKFSKLETFLLDNHSYDVPEIVGLNAEGVSETYLNWITEYVSETD